MDILTTKINGLLIIKPKVFEDARGYFLESYNKKKLESYINCDFVQDNQSESAYGTLRGLHYQLAPYSQAKLVRVLVGKIYDVAVDIREKSPTYGQFFGIELSSENKTQLYVPHGFAHGFSVLSEKAVVLYKTDGYYNAEAERGINFNDKSLNIDWKINISEAIVSAKDKVLPSIEDAEKNFNF